VNDILTTGRRTVCPELRIAGLVVRNLDAAAVDLSAASEFLVRPLHGVLGFSFLKNRVTRIDYFRRRIRFSDGPPPEQRPDGPGFISFPMLFTENSVLPVVQDCYVNGARLSVTLDTGSSLGLILFPRAIERLGLGELARSGIPMHAGGYLGRASLTKGWATSVKLGSIDLGAIEVAYVQKGYGEDETLARRGGNVGNAVPPSTSSATRGNFGFLDDMQNQVQNLMQSSSPSDQLKAQQLMNQFIRIFDSITTILSKQRDLESKIAQNLAK
jgi:hypothetical protein